MSIPLKCWLKWASCIFEETYKNRLCINRIWPRYRFSDQWRISLQLPKVCEQQITYISYSRRLVDKHLLSRFWCGRKYTLPVSYRGVMIECISYIYLISSRVMWWSYSLDWFLSILDLCICPMRTWLYQLFWALFVNTLYYLILWWSKLGLLVTLF